MKTPTLALALLSGALCGCAGMSLPADPSKMSAEQLTAMSKDRSASASCTVVNSPWGVGRSVYVQFDKATAPNSSITVNADCGVSLGTQQRTVITTTTTTP